MRAPRPFRPARDAPHLLPEVFARRGGLGDHHRDGRGVAFFDPSDTFICREPRPAADSPTVRFPERHGPASRTVISHIHRATRGDVRLPDTHPFVRELGGRIHVFARNGAVPDVADWPFPGRPRPAGGTDPERPCRLLPERPAPAWDGGVATGGERVGVLRTFRTEVAAPEPFDIFGAGAPLSAHAHRVGARRRRR